VAVDRSIGAGSVVVVVVVVVVGATVAVVVVLLVVEDEVVVVAGSDVVLDDMPVVDDSTTSVEVTSGRSADWAELAHDALTITTPITIPTRTTAVLDRLDGSICQPVQPELPVQLAVP
jgi:transcriptional regulator of nitric oxide reductase